MGVSSVENFIEILQFETLYCKRVMETKTDFRYKIHHDAFELMSKILRNPDVTGPAINGAQCRITGTHDILLSIKSNYWNEFREDELFTVRLLDNDSRGFVVLKSLLSEMDD